MHIATIKAEGGKVADLKKAILAVHGLCGKTDNLSPKYVEAFCFSIEKEDLRFWVSDGSYMFISRVRPDGLNPSDFKGTLRPSKFGTLFDAVKKAKKTLDIIITHNEETETATISVVTENGSVSASDSSTISHPLVDKFLDATDASFRDSEPVRLSHFNPAKYLPILNAFKGTLGFSVETQPGQWRVRTTGYEPFCRFEAIICGVKEPKELKA